MHPIQERTIDNFLSVSLIVLREVYYPIIREIVIVLFFYLERGCNFSSTQWKYFSSLVLDFFHIFLRVFRIKILLAILKDVEKVCKTKQKKSESTASSSWRISRAWGRETLRHQLLCALCCREQHRCLADKQRQQQYHCFSCKQFQETRKDLLSEVMIA